jgi:hypothetical protein
MRATECFTSASKIPTKNAKSKAARAKMEKVLASAGNGGRCYRFAVDSGEA